MPASPTCVDSSTNHDSTVVNFYSTMVTMYKSKENLRFWCLVTLFVPIGFFVMMHDDGTASDITIGLWLHNQQAMNHKHNGELWFSLPSSLAMKFTGDDMQLNEWYYEIMYKWCHDTRGNCPFINLKATKTSKRCVLVLVAWSWRLLEEWLEACGSLTMVGAGFMHGFGTEPIRNLTNWLVEGWN